MLYETLFQSQIFFMMLYFGMICGIIFEAKNLIRHALFDNKIISFVADFAFMCVSALIFVYSKNLLNFGEFRIYLLLAFVLGIIIEHISIGFLVEKLFYLMYNKSRKLYRRIFCKKTKSKFRKKNSK